VSNCPGDLAAKQQARRYTASITVTMEPNMRKPRDFDSELKALTDKANMLKEKKVRQFGELLIASGADALDPETLTGALLALAQTKDAKEREAWRASGAAFFRRQPRKSSARSASDTQSAETGEGNGTAL
jgi:DNA-binding protein H-NS